MTHHNGSKLVKQDSGLRTSQLANPAFVSPRADVLETPDAYILSLDMPGASKEEIAVSIDKDTLIVEGNVTATLADGGVILRNEIRAGRYERTFAIGQGIQKDAVDARFEHGVLTVKLYRAEEVKPREIVVH